MKRGYGQPPKPILILLMAYPVALGLPARAEDTANPVGDVRPEPLPHHDWRGQ